MYQLDINKGDIMLKGKYRNKKEVVKTFGHDEKGQPTINGKRICNFNIEKLLPKKEIKETMKKSELKEIIKECIQEVGIGSQGFSDREESDDTIEEMSDPENDKKAAKFLRDALSGLNNAARAANKNTIDGKEIRKLYAQAKKIYDGMK